MHSASEVIKHKVLFFPPLSPNAMVSPIPTPQMHTRIITLEAFITIGMLWWKDNGQLLITLFQFIKSNYTYLQLNS